MSLEPLDSMRLSLMQPTAQDAMDEGAAELDELLRRRSHLQQLRRAESNRLGQVQGKPPPSPGQSRTLKCTHIAVS